MNTRKVAVAGTFYPAKAEAINNQLAKILKKEQPYIDQSLFGKTIIGGVVPHAGYMFSGYQAIHFFETLKHAANKPETFIIINPNHTGYGPQIALDGNYFWESPYGDVQIDTELSNKLPFEKSKEAHKFEHSAEVMIPMLQYFLDYPFKILPITMGNQSIENAGKIADALSHIILGQEDKYCLIASSDFSHYIDPKKGKIADWPVLNSILDLDADAVFKQVKQESLSICGFGPIMTLINYSIYISRQTKTQLLKFGNSGEVMPSDKVVDYASILFYR